MSGKQDHLPSDESNYRAPIAIIYKLIDVSGRVGPTSSPKKGPSKAARLSDSGRSEEAAERQGELGSIGGQEGLHIEAQNH